MRRPRPGLAIAALLLASGCDAVFGLGAIATHRDAASSDAAPIDAAPDAPPALPFCEAHVGADVWACADFNLNTVVPPLLAFSPSGTTLVIGADEMIVALPKGTNVFGFTRAGVQACWTSPLTTVDLSAAVQLADSTIALAMVKPPLVAWVVDPQGAARRYFLITAVAQDTVQLECLNVAGTSCGATVPVKLAIDLFQPHTHRLGLQLALGMATADVTLTIDGAAAATLPTVALTKAGSHQVAGFVGAAVTGLNTGTLNVLVDDVLITGGAAPASPINCPSIP
jgi:hypothetical protein